jgi:hypothetical protein
MSRVFTINVSFKQKNYTALVSFRTRGYELSYLVKYLDEDVDSLIPGKKLQISLSGDIVHPKPESHLALDLVCKTTEAINCYLQLREN